MEEVIFERDEKGEILPTIQNFYKFCGQGRLMAVKCKKCNRILAPPRMLCPSCYSSDLRWIQLSGRGQLHTFSMINIAPKRFASQAPYTVGIVKLQEGISLPGRIMLDKPRDAQIGMDVIVDFEPAQMDGWPQLPRYFFRSVNKTSG